jgi:FdhE protein
LRKSQNLPNPPEQLLSYYTQLDEFIKDQTDSLKISTGAKSQYSEILDINSSLLEEGLVSMDNQQVAKNFQTLVEMLIENVPDNEAAKAIQKSINAGLLHANLWCDNIEGVEINLIGLAEKEKLDTPLLLELAYWAMTPYWRVAANDYKESLQAISTDERGTCPICGRHAELAILDDKDHGKRYLICINCDFRWSFKRIGCINCGNIDFKKLGYILVDNVDNYKFYHCEQCKTYLKTIDQRANSPRLSNNNFLIENVKTLFIDIIAKDKGYTHV